MMQATGHRVPPGNLGVYDQSYKCLSIVARKGATREEALVAQAMVERLAIVTRDESIADYDVDVIVA